MKRTTEESLDLLRMMARADAALKERLLSTEQAEQPLDAFCEVAKECGFDLTPGEVMESGQDYYDTLFKSCNGAAATPIEEWADAYEMFLASLW